jgi:uncharacterized alkaline shock family protein YloU
MTTAAAPPPRTPGAAGVSPQIVIAGEVIAAIGAHAAAGTPGVVRLESSLGGLLTGLGRTARRRVAGINPAPVTGTSATMAGEHVLMRVEIAVAGDRQAAATAADVQRSVARAVTANTGLPVAGVTVVILDVDLRPAAAGCRVLTADPAGERQATLPPSPPVPPVAPAAGAERSRAQVCDAVLAAVRAVPGLRPASPVWPERARWMPWDPGVLAVGLDDGRLEVQLAATRLPLPPLLDQAAAAIRDATAATRWAELPHRLVVAALDAAAFGAAPADGGLAGRGNFFPPP